MKKLRFDYEMLIEYSYLVTRCNFTIKCIPESNHRQKIENLKIEMSPDCPYSYGKDGLGNTQIYGLDEVPHDTFRFRISGDAYVSSAEYEEEADDDRTMIYRHPHGMNVAGEGLKKYFKRISPEEELTPLEKAEKMMHYLYRDFRYKPCTTDVNTTAEQAWQQGHGVCQDYAHILISLLHQANIPARYVTGLLIGEGQSHAWVEILQDDKWIGLDPANDMPVGIKHIKIGVGRDAHDCMINRGIMHGGGLHTQTITAIVTEFGV